MWADPAHLLDAWRYWRAWYHTGETLYAAYLEGCHRLDESREILPL
jgi:hypothetical protein